VTSDAPARVPRSPQGGVKGELVSLGGAGGSEPSPAILGPRETFRLAVRDVAALTEGQYAAIITAGEQFAAQLIERALRPQPVPGGLEAG
jgi:hypothetical protein